MVSAVAVALIMLVFAPYARFIPRAALAGILMVSAYKMVDWRALAYHFRTTRFDAAIVAVTAVSAVAISVEFCVLIGVFLSFLLTRAARGPHAAHRVRDRERRASIHERLPGRRALRADPDLRPRGRDVLRRDRRRSRATSRRSRSASARAPSSLVLRVKRARNPDAVGMTQLESFIERVKARGVHVLLCGVRPELADQLERTGLARRLGEKLFLEQPVRQTSTTLAVRHAYTLLPELCATCPRRHAGASDLGLHYVI